MSIYYALACRKCRTKVDFVTTACGYSIMGDETQPEKIAKWFGRHVGHKEEIAILSEHESEYDFIPDEVERDTDLEHLYETNEYVRAQAQMLNGNRVQMTHGVISRAAGGMGL